MIFSQLKLGDEFDLVRYRRELTVKSRETDAAVGVVHAGLETPRSRCRTRTRCSRARSLHTPRYPAGSPGRSRLALTAQVGLLSPLLPLLAADPVRRGPVQAGVLPLLPVLSNQPRAALTADPGWSDLEVTQRAPQPAI